MSCTNAFCVRMVAVVVLAACSCQAQQLPAEDPPASILRAEASHVQGELGALYDGAIGQTSGDYRVPRFTWWDRKGTQEWVGYRFDRPVTVSSMQIQWFDDTGRGQCRVPVNWRLLYRDGEQWRPVTATTPFGVQRHVLNEVRFAPVTTDGLKIEVQLQEGFSGGVLAWHVSGIARPKPPKPPFEVAADLFDHTNANTLGLPRAAGTETITIFAPTDDTDKFSHGTQLIAFGDHLYAMWQSAPVHEDSHDSRVMYSRSTDGQRWSDPVQLVAPLPDDVPGFRSGGGWWTDGKSLVAYIQRVSSWSGRGWRYTEYMTTTDGVKLTEPKYLLNHQGERVNGAIEESIAALPCGRLLVNFQGSDEDNTQLIVIPHYTDDPTGLSGWTPAQQPRLPTVGGHARGLEPGWFVQADGTIVNVFRDMHRSHRLLASISTDRGATWSDKALTDMPDSNSMQAAGNLPDGTAYMINNPVKHGRRVPLVVTLSRDGRLFDRAFLLRGGEELQPRRYDGRAKSPGYSYPGRLIWRGHLYAAYATNKEDVEITRVPLASLVHSVLPADVEEQVRRDITPPGVVVSHSPHGSRQFLGSPSIVVLDDGDYLASHDRYGAHMDDSTTHVYRSQDAGWTWRRLADIEDIGLHWASLFHHQDHVYLMGADGAGNTVMLRSADLGRTWTRPTDDTTGLLLRGSYHPLSPSWLIHDGRIWKPNEHAAPGVRWGPRFSTFMMSAPVDADLLRRDSWTHSNRLGYQGDWLNGRFGGWLEGNAVVTSDGQLINMLRVQFGYDRFTQTWRDYDGDGKAALVRISDDGRTATFDPTHDFIEFPGGLVRFQVRHDAQSGYYWSLTSYVPPAHRQTKRVSDRIRNTLALVRSKDLRNWEIRTIVLYHPDPMTRGFQNVAWAFDGDDIVAISRTSWPDATSASTRFQIDQAHDANYMTFHRIADFRQVSWDASVVEPAAVGMILPGTAVHP